MKKQLFILVLLGFASKVQAMEMEETPAKKSEKEKQRLIWKITNHIDSEDFYVRLRTGPMPDPKNSATWTSYRLIPLTETGDPIDNLMLNRETFLLPKGFILEVDLTEIIWPLRGRIFDKKSKHKIKEDMDAEGNPLPTSPENIELSIAGINTTKEALLSDKDKYPELEFLKKGNKVFSLPLNDPLRKKTSGYTHIKAGSSGYTTGGLGKRPLGYSSGKALEK